MNKFFCVIVTLLCMEHVQALPHPTCQKFFTEMETRIADIRDEKDRLRVRAHWTPTKNKMLSQTQGTQAKACQNGLLSLRSQVK